MSFNNSTPNESNWAEEEEEEGGQRLMWMIFIKAAAKRCQKKGKKEIRGKMKSEEMHVQEAP